jgi:D-amino peptidase
MARLSHASGGRAVILGDIEGIIGVDDWRQIFPGAPGYAAACRAYAADVNACARGLLAGGADEVLLVDTHAAGTNLDTEEIPHCRAFRAPNMMGRVAAAFDEGIDALVLLGFHAAAGTGDGFVPHSFAPATRSWIDGQLAGEPAFYALMAAARAVPTVLITGDAQTIEQVRPFAPLARAVQTKESGSPWAATSFDPDKTRLAIERTAAGAYRSRRDRAVELPPPTLTLTVEAQTDVGAELIQTIPGMTDAEGRSATFTGAWPDVWRAFVTANSLATLAAAAAGSWFFGPIENSLVEGLANAAGERAVAARNNYFAAQFSPPWGPACPPHLIL